MVAIGGPMILVILLSWPLLFSNRTFNEDWLNHLWYIWHQSLTIRENHLPSLFLNYSHGVFYPEYAFYGGTLYSLAGALSLALGNAPLQAYVLTYMLGFLAAYLGWYWMSRLFGLGRWVAHAPGIVFVTSASYLMIIYGIGDWPEFLAVSVMPLMIASGLAILRAEQLQLLPMIALAASSVIFFGSHLLTVIWGSTILAIAGLALLAGVPEARRHINRRAVIRLAWVGIPALLVSAWFLLPTAAYESNTVVARSYPIYRHLLLHTMLIVAARNLFTLSRDRVPGTITTTALPVLAMAWVLVGIAVAPRARRRGTWMRVLLVLIAVTTLLLIMMTHSELILALPRIYATVQFSFRLESYVLLGISGAVLAVLVLNSVDRRSNKLWTWTLVPILAVSVVGAVLQASKALPGRSRDTALSSYLKPTYEQEGLFNYVDDGLRVITARLPLVSLPPGSVHDNRATTVVHEPPGRLMDSNIRTGPEFIHLTGARVVGIDIAANDVLEITGSGPPSRADSTHGHPGAFTETVSVSTAASVPIVAGRILTVLALLLLAAEILLLGAPRAAVKRITAILPSTPARQRAQKTRDSQ
jgi:hypothetical protein